MNKRKVLFVIESLAGGGAEKVLSILVKYLDASKFDVSLCTIVNTGTFIEDVLPYVHYSSVLPCYDKLSFFGKILYHIRYRLVYQILPLSWVYRWFIPQGNDVEVAFIEGFVTKLISHSTNAKARKCAWVHTDLQNNHWTVSLYGSLEKEKKVYEMFSSIACVSQTAKEGMRTLFPSSHTISHVVYNPIESTKIKKMAEEKIMLKHQSPLLVTVGRLEPQKGYDRLVRIVKRLFDAQYRFELWILGVGSMEKELKEYVEANQLDGVVKFLGFHSNPYKYIVQGDLFVCSSRSEGYSTAVTEALILGLPVVTTECSGMKELLHDGEFGIITENDDEALYEGIRKMLDDASVLSHYKEKAIERGNDFKIENLMKPIEELLQS